MAGVVARSKTSHPHNHDWSLQLPGARRTSSWCAGMTTVIVLAMRHSSFETRWSSKLAGYSVLGHSTAGAAACAH